MGGRTFPRASCVDSQEIQIWWVIMWLPMVAESTKHLGFLDEYLQILSHPALSWTLLLSSLKAYIILLASTVSLLTWPTMLLSTDLLRQRTHSDHLWANRVPPPNPRPCDRCLGSINYGCPWRLYPRPSAHLPATCALIASPLSLLHRMLSWATAHFHSGLAEHHTLLVSEIGLVILSRNTAASWIPFHSSFYCWSCKHLSQIWHLPPLRYTSHPSQTPFCQPHLRNVPWVHYLLSILTATSLVPAVLSPLLLKWPPISLLFFMLTSYQSNSCLPPLKLLS